MFPPSETLRTGFSLMPLTELPQKEVSVMTRSIDVVKRGSAANFAGIIDHDIAKAEDSLRNGSRDGHVLDLCKQNVARRAGNQTMIYLDLRFGQRVANHVPPQMVPGGNQQQA